MDNYVSNLESWFVKNRRELPWRMDKNPYHVWISEIMLQQTRIEAVLSYYERFMKELPTISSLADVSEDRLLKLWQGLGYYNRARNLKRAAVMIMEQYGGIFLLLIQKLFNYLGLASIQLVRYLQFVLVKGKLPSMEM